MAGPRVGKTIREKTSLLPGSCAPSGHLRAVGVSPFTSPPPATGKGSLRCPQSREPSTGVPPWQAFPEVRRVLVERLLSLLVERMVRSRCGPGGGERDH